MDPRRYPRRQLPIISDGQSYHERRRQEYPTTWQRRFASPQLQADYDGYERLTTTANQSGAAYYASRDNYQRGNVDEGRVTSLPLLHGVKYDDAQAYANLRPNQHRSLLTPARAAREDHRRYAMRLFFSRL
jgi:hypothetical protein